MNVAGSRRSQSVMRTLRPDHSGPSPAHFLRGPFKYHGVGVAECGSSQRWQGSGRHGDRQCGCEGQDRQSTLTRTTASPPPPPSPHPSSGGGFHRRRSREARRERNDGDSSTDCTCPAQSIHSSSAGGLDVLRGSPSCTRPVTWPVTFSGG